MEYQLTLPPAEIIRCLQGLSIEARRSAQRTLRIARSTRQWGERLRERLTTLCQPHPPEAIYRVHSAIQQDGSTRAHRARRYREPFSAYVLSVMTGLLQQGVECISAPDRMLYGPEESYADLGYHPQADAGTWSDRASYRKDARWCLSQLTVALNAALRGQTLRGPVLMVGRVCRRQNPDATHAREFTQLEYRAPGGAEPMVRLHAQMVRVTRLLGLDPALVVWKPTHNTYTAPSLQGYYRSQGRLIEFINGGVFLPSVSGRAQISLPPGQDAVGFGLGLQRAYMLRYGLRRLAQV